MVTLQGIPAAYNYTYGPALIYEGPSSIDRIYKQGIPVVVVCEGTIPMDELRRIELTRVRGFIMEGGRATDEDLYNFLMNEKRAAVIGCAGATQYILEGEWICVDGVEGIVCIDPDEYTLGTFEAKRAEGPPTD